jgi:hypothetical protein
MGFSKCGNFFFGTKIGVPDRGAPVFVNVSSMLSQEPLSIADTTSTMSRQSATCSKENRIVSTRDGKLILGEVVAPQISGMVDFSNIQGQMQISALTQHGDRGSVILETMRADGMMIEETVTRIPKSSTLEKSYSSLVPTDNQNTLRLILNMASQDTYSVNEVPDFKLPAVLDRNKDSIPVQVYTNQQRIESSTKRGKRCIEEESVYDSRETILCKKRR